LIFADASWVDDATRSGNGRDVLDQPDAPGKSPTRRQGRPRRTRRERGVWVPKIGVSRANEPRQAEVRRWHPHLVSFALSLRRRFRGSSRMRQRAALPSLFHKGRGHERRQDRRALGRRREPAALSGPAARPVRMGCQNSVLPANSSFLRAAPSFSPHRG